MRSYNKFPAFLVDLDGKVREITPDNDQFFTLREIVYYLKTITPEFLKTSDGRVIICCSELQKDPLAKRNVVASLLYMHGDQDQVRGKAIVCQSKFIH